jgi:hypothetical protein
MPTRKVDLPEQDEQAKLAWLRAAAKEGFDAIDRGDYIVLESPEHAAELMKALHDRVMTRLAAERTLGNRPPDSL